MFIYLNKINRKVTGQKAKQQANKTTPPPTLGTTGTAGTHPKHTLIHPDPRGRPVQSHGTRNGTPVRSAIPPRTADRD